MDLANVKISFQLVLYGQPKAGIRRNVNHSPLTEEGHIVSPKIASV